MDLLKAKKRDSKAKLTLYKTVNYEKNYLKSFTELFSIRGLRQSMSIRPKNSKSLKNIPTRKYLNAIQNGLISKYSCKEDDYDNMILDSLLYNKNTHVVSVFKNYMILDYIDEFLKRVYNSEEAYQRIPKIANYYKNYLKFFCNPIFRDFGINGIIQSYSDYKAEVYYNKNYGKKQSNNKNGNNENIRQIFDTTIRENIENNSMTNTTIKMDNSILTTKRNNFDSFRDKMNDTLLSFNSIVPTGRSKEDSILHYLSMLDNNNKNDKKLEFKKIQPEKVVKVRTHKKFETKSQDFDLKKSENKNIFKYIPAQAKSSSVQKSSVISPVLTNKYTKLKLSERTKLNKESKVLTNAGSLKQTMKNSNIIEEKKISNSEIFAKDKAINNINAITDLMKITLSVCVDKTSRNIPYSKNLSSSNTINTGTFNILDSARKSTTIINKVDSINNFNININNPIISESIHSTLLNMKDNKKAESVLTTLLEKNKAVSRNKNSSIYKMSTTNLKEEKKEVEKIFNSYNSKIIFLCREGKFCFN
jgi:hypothetical protein